MESGTVSALNVSSAAGTGLRLSSEVYEALRAEAFEGLKALPRRGLEIGGILTQRAGAEATSLVDGFERIPCEHLYGPSYRLSPFDRENLRARCREIQAGSALHLVCFFRSSTREVFQLTPDDVLLAGELSDNAGVVLIQPAPTGRALFRVFQPEKDGAWCEFEPFEVTCELVPQAPAIPAAPVSAATAPPATAEDSHPPALPRVDFPRRFSHAVAPARSAFISPWALVSNWKMVLGSAALVAAFLLAAFFVVAPGRRKIDTQTAAPSPNPDLGMQVVSQGDSLRLTWNRNLPPVRNSTGGNLEILDGGQYRQVALDSAQVAQAVIYYTPSSDDVIFRLNIQGRAPAKLTGIARILASRKPAAPSLTASNVPPAISPPVQPVPRPPVVERQPPVGRAQARRSKSSFYREPLRAREPQSSSSRADLRQRHTEEPNRLPPTIVPAVKPAVTNAEASEVKKSSETASSAPATPPTASSLQPRVQPPPAGPGASPPVAGRGALEDRLNSASTAPAPAELPVPPRPLTKIMPVRRSSSEPAVVSPMTVTVQVTIDSQGKVIEAHAQPSPSKYWADKAVEAARQWRFQPAKLHGQSVPSVSTIAFRFNPE